MATIKQRHGSNYWYLCFRVPGRKTAVEFSTRTKDRRLAEEMRRVVEGRLAALRLFSMLRSETRIPAAPSPAPPAKDWARGRWHKLNTRERQAVVFVMNGGKCTYCARDVTIPLRRDELRRPDRAVMDHVIPVASGGSNGPENVTLACHACNVAKCDKDADAFTEDLLKRALEPE